MMAKYLSPPIVFGWEASWYAVIIGLAAFIAVIVISVTHGTPNRPKKREHTPSGAAPAPQRPPKSIAKVPADASATQDDFKATTGIAPPNIVSATLLVAVMIAGAYICGKVYHSAELDLLGVEFTFHTLDLQTIMFTGWKYMSLWTCFALVLVIAFAVMDRYTGVLTGINKQMQVVTWSLSLLSLLGSFALTAAMIGERGRAEARERINRPIRVSIVAEGITLKDPLFYAATTSDAYILLSLEDRPRTHIVSRAYVKSMTVNPKP